MAQPSSEPQVATAPTTSGTDSGTSQTTAQGQTTAADTTTSAAEPTTSSSTIPSTTTTSSSSESTSSQQPPTTTSNPTTTTSSTSSEPPTTSSTEPSSTSSVVTTSQISTATPTVSEHTLTLTSTDTSLSKPTNTVADGASATRSGASATTSAGGGDGGSGLSAGGTIAVAVVVPVVSVAIIIVAALYFWRKRKAKKAAEEERRKEVEEYGFNPNNDPTLPPIMGGAAFEPKDDVSGYRGWGTTSAGRKASTNLSSGPGVGLAMSETGSTPGYHHAATPSDGTIQYSEGQLTAAETEPIGILGAAPVAASNNRTTDIHRGPSNASSAYSTANRSEVSDESHMSGAHAGAFYDDNPYYNDTHPQYTAYSDGPYGGNQPVIRDVQARRNTRIENPAVFPRSGNAGIAQNF